MFSLYLYIYIFKISMSHDLRVSSLALLARCNYYSYSYTLLILNHYAADICVLTVRFDYYDNTNCSCSVQVTPELNQQHFLILNGESIYNCSRCLDESVNNYIIHMETDDGSISNSLIVTYFPIENSYGAHMVITQTS